MFSQYNNRISIKGNSENVRRCKEDFEFSLSRLINSATRFHYSNEGSGQAETPTTLDEEITYSGVFIEPEYQWQAIGENQCVLKALEDTYYVKLVFSELNNRLTIAGYSENVKRCKDDVQLNMAVRRWWYNGTSEDASLAHLSTNQQDSHQQSAPRHHTK